MAEIRATFLCVGGVFTPVLPVDPDLNDRVIDQVHYFSAQDVSRMMEVPEPALHEAYSVFLQEVGNGLKGAEDTAVARRVLRNKYAHLSDEQFEEFLVICNRRGCNPFGRYLWPETFHDGETGKPKLEVLLTVDGFFAKAMGSGQLQKFMGPEFSSGDGKWTDTWASVEPPAFARVHVQRAGMAEPMAFIAKWSMYAPKRPNGDSEKPADPFWGDNGDFMLGKCCSCLGLRRAFADLLDGFYSPEEMAQARGTIARRRRASGLEPQAIDEGALPENARAFHHRLIDLGFQDPVRRNKLISHFRAQYPQLYSKDLDQFHRRVLDEIMERPDAYGVEMVLSQ